MLPPEGMPVRELIDNLAGMTEAMFLEICRQLPSQPGHDRPALVPF